MLRNVALAILACVSAACVGASESGANNSTETPLSIEQPRPDTTISGGSGSLVNDFATSIGANVDTRKEIAGTYVAASLPARAWSGDTVFLEVEVGITDPGYRLQNEDNPNVLIISVPTRQDVGAYVLTERIGVSVYRGTLLEPERWDPASSDSDHVTAWDAFVWTDRLASAADGSFAAVVLSFVPELTKWVLSEAYGLSIGHLPIGPAFDSDNEEVDVEAIVFGAREPPEVKERVTIPLRVEGDGSGDINIHLTYQFTDSGGYVVNTASVQLDPLQIQVRPRDLELDQPSIPVSASAWILERGDPARSAWNTQSSPAPPLRQLWTVEDLIGVRPLVGTGMIFVSFLDGPGALSRDGQVAWRGNEGQKGLPAALVGQTLILERGFDGLHALDSRDGQELWNYNSSSTSRGSGLALVGGELVWGGQVIDSETGAFLRELDTVWCWSDWKAASDSTLFSPSLREIAVCDPASGALIERLNIGTGVIRYPVYADGVIYAATGKPSVIAVSAATGEVLAEVALDERTRTGVAVGEGRVYLAAATGVITAHAQPDLTPAWSQDLGSSSPSPLTVAGGRLWTTTEDNRLVALDASTGALVWEGQLGFDAGGVLKAEVVVAGGMVLVMETGCSRCRLQAWGRP